MKVIAVVVTYNRKKLLKECLESLLNQTKEVDKIILIDNNSSDGTGEFLEANNMLANKKIIYRKLEKNIGGAGGFYEGIKDSLKYYPDWVWVMDDDTIPTENCLEELIKPINYIEEEVSFLASSVFGQNGEPINVPKINMEKCDNGYPDWYKYLDKGIIKISQATFVSVLIKKEAIEKVGLPMRNFFIWGDDTEYIFRLNKYFGNGFFVGKSKTIHKRIGVQILSIYNEDNLNRINMYYYMVRNELINSKAYFGMINMLMCIFQWQKKSLGVLIKKNKHRIRKFIVIHKAILAYIFRLYDVKAFKNRLDINVKYKNV